MNALRQHFRNHPRAAAWLVALALLAKLLIPAGYMPATERGLIRIELCSGFGAETRQSYLLDVVGHHGPDGKDKADSPCSFTALGGFGLGGGDPFWLAAPYPLAAATPSAEPAPLGLAAPDHLRPPPRGPPAA